MSLGLAENSNITIESSKPLSTDNRNYPFQSASVFSVGTSLISFQFPSPLPLKFLTHHLNAKSSPMQIHKLHLHSPEPLLMSTTPLRTPRWVSIRRLIEQNLVHLHKCTNLNHTKQLHAQLLKSNLHQDPLVASKLIASFSLCHHMVLALSVFHQIQQPDVHLYNTLIRAYVHNSQTLNAFNVFFQMQRNGVFADNFTYPFLLKACSGGKSLPLVQMLHTHIEKFGFFKDIFVPNSLIDTYSKCGSAGVTMARKLFNIMEKRDIVSWNSMISGLVRVGELREACQLFDEMPERDVISWNTILDGYAKAGEMNAAFELFSSMPERNVVSWSTMISGYSKAGDMDMARMIFDRMPTKTLVPWTIIVSGYAEKGMSKEAIHLYDQMEAAGLIPDEGTIISVLGACAESGLLGLGEKAFESIKRNGYKCNTLVSNALADMYVKCGNLRKALAVFNGMVEKDVVSWNIMIHGLGMHGYAEKALQLFSKMKQEGAKPDGVTFIGVLCACIHAGFTDEGLGYFREMERLYGIVPQVEHYGCVVDLLGRGGRLKEAFDLVRRMQVEPNAVIWGTLLGACRMHNDVTLAAEVLDCLSGLETDSGNLSMLSNIYAAAGDWDIVANFRLQRKSMKLQKASGQSSVEVNDEVHDFTAFDTSHTESDVIYHMISRLDIDIQEAENVPLVY